MKRSRRLVSILLTLAMLVTILASPALAATNNRTSNVPSIADDAVEAQLGSVTFQEDSDFTSDLEGGKTFTVTFPSGVKIKNQDAGVAFATYRKDIGGAGDSTGECVVTYSGDYTVDVTIPAGFGINTQDQIVITPVVTIDGFSEGDIKMTVDELDTGITGGEFVVGRVGSSATTASVISVEDISEDGGAIGNIRITESSLNAIEKNTNQTFKLKLPNNFEWDNDVTVTFFGGFNGGAAIAQKTVGAGVTLSADKEDATVTFAVPNVTRTQRGIIQIAGSVIPNNDADLGEIEVSIDGLNSDIDDADVVAANYVDYGVTVEADSDVENINPGEMDSDLADLKIEESASGSIVDSRKTTVEFPSWVKINDVNVKTDTNCTVNLGTIDKTDNQFDFDVTGLGGGTAEIVLEISASIKGNAEGDITAKLSGRAGIEGEVVLGKAVPRVSITSDAKDIKVGVKDQPIGDITIAETDKEGLMEGDLEVVLPDGVEWSEVPTVEVLEGNVDISADDIDTSDNVLTIPVDSQSTKVSKIKISNAKVDLDRTIPEGSVDAKIKGSAVIVNDKGQGVADDLEDLEFDQDWAVKSLVARVATPAPGETKANAAFVIGSTTYKLNGVDTTMDVAPYIKDGRTYMPIRYVAYALGVADNNILWDGAAGKVTLIKGDKVVQLTIGSKVLLVNGATITMDVAPEITSDRTMLPIRHVAEVLGATVGWDETTQTVSIN